MPVNEERTSNEFWKDMRWALDHYQELMEKYPEMWVAVVDKKVVSSGHNIAKIRKTASKETGRLHIPVLFVEDSPHVY
ncbi:MAG: DUF5678 domain-containing protein [bacterium]|nr:DUF5678 domain-containing protein [bacterium]